MSGPPTDRHLPWSRQGARNVAGVTYQVAVSAHLLILGRAGRLPITSVTPEGTEDVDCACADGSSLFVQAKERGDGTGVLTCAEIAQVLDHAIPALEVRERSQFILVTNARLGSDFTFTGWISTISEAFPDEKRETLLRSLTDRVRAESAGVLRRSLLVSLERQQEIHAAQLLSSVYRIPISVARLAYSRLLVDLGEIAAVQRARTPLTAIVRQLSDLDVLVNRVVETVDVRQLDTAVRNGIVEPLDFTSASELSPECFLLGVEATPGHIAANLDILRPALSSAIDTCLQSDGYVVIAGPSGTGKSSLLWRFSRDCGWVAGKARILRIGTDDVAELLRWVRLQQPSAKAPLLLCIDNLGRPSTGGWCAAVEQLRAIPGVVILGAVRREDFISSLVATSPSVIEPVLDLPLARSIDQTLRERGISTCLDPEEAFAQSKQLLMEFLSLLLSGRRMREVVAAQVQDRLTPDRVTEKEALRYVCTAHRVGLSIPADTLGHLLGCPADLHNAMVRLKSEHLLTENERTEWVGLHELRSEIICDVLHSLPPPTEASTYAALLRALPSPCQPILLKRYGYFSRSPIGPLASVVVELLNTADISLAAQLVNSLRECEAIRHARECLRVVRATPDSTGVSTSTRLLLALLVKETGFTMPLQAPEIQTLARELPPRPPSLVTQVLKQIASERIKVLAKSTNLADVVDWLSALEGYVDLSTDTAREIWSAHDGTWTPFHGRLLASLARLARLTSEQLEDMAGPVEDRSENVARLHPGGLRRSTNTHPDDGLVVTIEVLVPTSLSDVNTQVVSVAEQIMAACPEAAVAEVITREPGGQEYVVAIDIRPGYKRIPRKNLPRPTENRPHREVLDAAERLLSARFWTQRLRLEAELATEDKLLLEQLPDRLLNRHDHAGRRQAWKQRAIALSGQELPPPPQQESEQKTEDPAQQALQKVGDALARLAGDLDAPPTGRWYGAACQLREAIPMLTRARIEARPTLPSVGEPIPDALIGVVRRSADLLFALAPDQGRQHFRHRGSAPDWPSVAAQVISETRQRQLDEERSTLDSIMLSFGITADISAIVHDAPDSHRLVSDRWVVWLDWRSWESAPHFLNLSVELRSQLAFRLFIVASEREFALPFHAIQLGSDQIFPLDAATVEECCRVVQKKYAMSPHLPTWEDACAGLVEASRLGALYWSRPTAWRRQTDIEAAQKLIAQAAATFLAVPDPGIQEAFEELCNIVRAELQNGGPPLAAAFYGFPMNSPDSSIVRKIGNLKLAIAACEIQFPTA
jgi:hypothetical protein